MCLAPPIIPGTPLVRIYWHPPSTPWLCSCCSTPPWTHHTVYPENIQKSFNKIRFFNCWILSYYIGTLRTECNFEGIIGLWARIGNISLFSIYFSINSLHKTYLLVCSFSLYWSKELPPPLFLYSKIAPAISFYLPTCAWQTTTNERKKWSCPTMLRRSGQLSGIMPYG